MSSTSVCEGFVLRIFGEISSNVQTTRYRRSLMMISNGWRMPNSAEPRGRIDCKRRTSSGKGEFQSVMV